MRDNPVELERRRVLSELAARRLDLLVIGGGIVGAGVARDAAMRGLETGLIDARDFAFGTSSRSSRLLHGGIRYLAQGRLGLVREASTEKRILREIAPHLAEPLPFVFPAYKGGGWPLWQLRIGVKIYDWLCSGANLGRSEGFDRAQALQAVPGLRKDGLKGAVRYFDGFTQDARLVLDTLRSAQANGGLLANYVAFEKVTGGDGFVCGVRDVETNQTFDIQARTVVNATGPWSQGIGFSKVRLRLTKGVHLVFDRRLLPVSSAVVLTEGSRILFVIPWGERVIVGTTDTDYSGSLENVRAQEEDIRYLLAQIRRYFPGSSLAEDQIVSTWAGVRPLLDEGGKPSDISRSHRIAETQAGWWDVAGGKLTTYRLMAEQVVDQIAAKLAGAFRECETHRQPLLPEGEARGMSQVVPPSFSRELIRHYCEREWARHLEDVLVRRTSWAQYEGQSADRTAETAECMAETLGWTDARKADEAGRAARFCSTG